MRAQAQRLVLVGDHKQLPALVQSKHCQQAKFGRSLMERLMDLGVDSTMLNVQHRMHPSISVFPSQQFYGGRLEDHHPTVTAPPSSRTPGLGIHQGHGWPDPDFPSYAFFNVVGTEKSNRASSLRNEAEADLILFLIQSFRRKYQEFKGGIGIISPYGHQVSLEIGIDPFPLTLTGHDVGD